MEHDMISFTNLQLGIDVEGVHSWYLTVAGDEKRQVKQDGKYS